MAMSAEAYLAQLQALLPPGAAWTREPDSDLTRTLIAFADEFARVEESAETLLDEADPRTATALLPEWEADTGLPDPFTGELATVQERRVAVRAKLLSCGGQSIAFFVGFAAAVLGVGITITEFRPFAAGSLVGDALTSSNQWGITWQVNVAPDSRYRHFVAGSAAGEPLVTDGRQLLEWAIARLKPAHTRVIFNYL